MSQPQRIAYSLPQPPNPNATVQAAVWAEGEGFDDVWFADGGGQDALTLAGAVALKTSRVRIGTAVVPVYTRTPALFASTAMTLSHLAPNRFILGLGASSHAMIEGWHGMKLEKPLTRVKETTQLVRAMLAGEKSDFQGATLQSQGYRVNPPMQGHVPIYLAALREKMLEMAGEVGEGVVLNLFPVEALPVMIKHVEIGAKRAGVTLAEREVVCRHQVAVIEDEKGRAAARDAFRKSFAPYYATPVYNRFLVWCGYQSVAETITEGWKAKDRARTTGALSDELVDRIAVIGTAEECRQRVLELAKTGVNTHIISPLSEDPKAREAAIQAFHPRNFSLRTA